MRYLVNKENLVHELAYYWMEEFLDPVTVVHLYQDYGGLGWLVWKVWHGGNEVMLTPTVDRPRKLQLRVLGGQVSVMGRLLRRLKDLRKFFKTAEKDPPRDSTHILGVFIGMGVVCKTYFRVRDGCWYQDDAPGLVFGAGVDPDYWVPLDE